MEFGIFLVDRGAITAEQFIDALRLHVDQRVPLGQLAIEQDLLSVRQVFEILRSQSDDRSELFGEKAVELGMLNKQEVADLLLAQADRRLPMADALVDLGILTEEQLEAEMAAFRRRAERRGSTVTLARRAMATPSEAEFTLAGV